MRTAGACFVYLYLSLSFSIIDLGHMVALVIALKCFFASHSSDILDSISEFFGFIETFGKLNTTLMKYSTKLVLQNFI